MSTTTSRNTMDHSPITNNTGSSVGDEDPTRSNTNLHLFNNVDTTETTSHHHHNHNNNNNTHSTSDYDEDEEEDANDADYESSNNESDFDEDHHSPIIITTAHQQQQQQQQHGYLTNKIYDDLNRRNDVPEEKRVTFEQCADDLLIRNSSIDDHYHHHRSMSDPFHISDVQVIPEVTLMEDENDDEQAIALSLHKNSTNNGKNSIMASNGNSASGDGGGASGEITIQIPSLPSETTMSQMDSLYDFGTPPSSGGDKERMNHLKSLMLADLSVGHVPLTQFSVPSTIVLPSEQQKARSYAIGTKVRRRDRMIHESFRQRRQKQRTKQSERRSGRGIGESVDGISTMMDSGDRRGGFANRDRESERYSIDEAAELSLPSNSTCIPTSRSMEQLDRMESRSSRFGFTKRHPWARKIADFMLGGPLWTKTKRLKRSTSLQDVGKEDEKEVQATIIDLGYALSIYGTPAHRLEYHLALVASYYALNCTTYSTPNGIWITFGNYVTDTTTTTHFIKIRGASLNLSKLCLLDEVAEKIASGTMAISEARKAIKEVIELEPVYSNFIFIIFSCFVQAGMFSVFFAANFGEILASFAAGLIVGALSVLASKYEALAQVNTIVCALAAGFVGLLFRIIMSSIVPISVFVVSLSGVISLLPGLTFTLAISELSSRNLLSGSTRLISAFVTTIQIGFGVLVSDRASQYLSIIASVPEVVTRHYHSVFTLAGIIPVVVMATVISLKAPKYPIAFVFILLDAYAAFFCTYYATSYFGVEVGTMLGSFVVGFISNVFAAVSDHPGIVVSACGIIFCLPGALGKNSARILIEGDPTRFVLEVVIIGISLTVGLMLSDAFGFKRKKLNL